MKETLANKNGGLKITHTTTGRKQLTTGEAVEDKVSDFNQEVEQEKISCRKQERKDGVLRRLTQAGQCWTKRSPIKREVRELIQAKYYCAGQMLA